MEESEIGEVGVDKVNEEASEHAKEHAGRAPWLRWLALSTAFFAVLAAIASLKSGQLANDAILRVNESTLAQAKASDQWSYYQAKGIKSVTRDAQADILEATKGPEAAITKARKESARLKDDQTEITKKARELEADQAKALKESEEALHHHHKFAYVVTSLQVAIGLSAVAALLEKKSVWLFALAAGVGGIGLFAMALLAH